MYIHKLKEEILLYPLVCLSSLKPSTENDWSAWEDDDQEILAYEDIVWLGVTDEDWWEKDYAISVISENIQLKDYLDEPNSILQNHRKVWEGSIKLKDCMFAVQFDISNGEKIKAPSDLICVEIFVDYSLKVPSVVFKIEEQK